MTPLRSALTRGLLLSLDRLEDGAAYTATRALYAAHIPAGVYLRPTDEGFTVMSLDWQECASMIGVGRDSKNSKIARIPPDPARVTRAVAGYREKLASLERRSSEERGAVRAIAGALASGLKLPKRGLYFVHQEWRFPSGDKLDLLAVDPEVGQLKVIELKRSQRAAERHDLKKGGDALQQARQHARVLHEHRRELYPYFTRLARALARHHDGPAAMKNLELDPEHVPDAIAAWPGLGRW